MIVHLLGARPQVCDKGKLGESRGRKATGLHRTQEF